MIPECANPDCRARSRDLDHGRLFVASHPARQWPRKAPAKTTEYFWLCDKCGRDSELEVYIPHFDIFLGHRIHGAIELCDRGCA